ncbi:MAG: hypothetical protein K9N49_07400, partial [Candidatus Marinimicrobia bacterium]|nr:hypothetical protein [Candidatus Neomarinimicrobiota bacterium]
MTRRLHLGALLVGVLLGTGEGDARAAILPPVALNEGTTPLAVLVLPATPDPLEQLAARELGDHLQLMTGAELPRAISGHEPAGLLPVHLGAAADPALDALSLAAGNNPSTFTLRVTPERIDLRGLSPEGTLFAAYELLEQLGFRWYMPGELGCVLPTDPVARLTAQTTTQAPSMDLRLLQPWIEAQHGWIARMRLGGQRRATGSHGFPGDPPRGALGG